MKLYQEIIFLKHYFTGKWCVENVIGFYEPLIKPTEFGGHWFWSSFLIRPFNSGENRGHDSGIEGLAKRKGISLDGVSGIDKRLALRNCVEPELGKHILDLAINPIGYQNSLI